MKHDKPYLVHTEGPDDIEYCDTWAEACRYAQSLNEVIVDHAIHSKIPGWLRCWAIPYLSTDYEERWEKLLPIPARPMNIYDGRDE